MNENIYKLAHDLTKEHFYECQMNIMGAKIVDKYMYVIGGDNGFPHTRAHVKVDLDTNKIVAQYGAWDCPVRVSEGSYY